MANESVTCYLIGGSVVTEKSSAARELYDKNRFGSLKGNAVALSILETAYLLEKERITLQDGRGKTIEPDKFLRTAVRQEPRFTVRYPVFRDIRDRGYIIKTALKFGADFRIYERGAKPGEKHAKWVVFPVHEGDKFTWQDFSAKNRVAHSTKKKLLLGVVDDEQDVSYWEVQWVRP